MFAAICIPNFQLQAVLRHEQESHSEPVALLRDDSPKSPIWQLTENAMKAGISDGMSSTQAKARCQSVRFRLRSSEQEEAAQEILLESAYASAAFIESTAPGVCLLDLRGLPILQADEFQRALSDWAAQALDRLARFNLHARLGVARTPGLALQAAGIARPFLHVSDPDAFRKALPLNALTDSVEMLGVLGKWGIKTVAEFLALGKERIGARLGLEGIKLFAEARADEIRPLKLTSPQQVYREFFEFEQHVETVEPLLFILRRFLGQLTGRLEVAFLAVAQLDVTLRLDSGGAHERALRIPSPTRDVDTLFRLVHNHLETVRTPSPVVAIALRAHPCAVDAQQFQLFESAVRDPNRFFETVGRVAALLGPDRVGCPVVKDSHKSDDFQIEPVTARMIGPAQNGREQSPETGSGAAGGVPRGLFLRRFRPPLPASVKLREGQPVYVRCSAAAASIIRSQGPFRSSGEWWENLWTREEWDVETKQGELYRIYIEGANWFVEGVYD